MAARFLVAVVSLAAVAASGQAPSSGLAPEVLTLARAKRRMGRQLDRTSNLACLETINRVQLKASGKQKRADTVRLEVAYIDKKELFSWPGKDEFGERSAAEIVGGGVTGSGGFLSTARTVFLGHHTLVRYAGDETVGGRRLLRYDYKVPITGSGYTLNINGRQAHVPYSGSFWVDPKTLDVMRLTQRADDIPPNIPATAVLRAVDYSPVRIGDGEVLLPQLVETEIRFWSGEVNRNLTEFSHCREYTGKATISFTPATEPTEPAPARPARPKLTDYQLPAGLRLTVKLEQAIVSGAAAVGDRVRARTVSEAKRKKKVIVPAGALLLGRIRWLEKRKDGYLLGIEFTEIQWDTYQARFLAKFLDVLDASGRVQPFQPYSRTTRLKSQTPYQYGGRFERFETKETFEYLNLPGVALLKVKGDSFRVPPGLQLVWTTE